MNMLNLIAETRGGIPEKCDFCDAPFTKENYPTPEEGGEWACITCSNKWDAEVQEKKL